MQFSRALNWMIVGMIGVATALSAQATIVSYDLNLVSGTTWEYDFTVSNDSLAGPIDEFTVFFDRTRFTNLQSVAEPSGWNTFTAQPDLGLPQDGFFDWLALGPGVAAGQSLGVFQVRVDFNGAATPDGPSFEVVDPMSFATLDRGLTNSNQVPEPGTLPLLAATLLVVALGNKLQLREIRAEA